MILRALLAVPSRKLRAEVRRAIDEVEVEVLFEEAGSTEELWSLLRTQPFDLIACQALLLGERPFATVEEIRRLPDPPAVIVLASGSDSDTQPRYLAAGAMAVVDEAATESRFVDAIKALIKKRREHTLRKIRADGALHDSRLSDFASRSPAMRDFLATVRKVVRSDCSLLITGETGVGKEYLARAIFRESPRSNGPFVAINCAALPEALIESELFGHVTGAFTGAERNRRGHFELAHGGTVFLDEIGELPMHLQVKLLRVLQEFEIQPVGRERPISIDVRVFAASNRNLKAEIEASRFRRDLYYRLGVVTLEVPPLRERKEDIPDLVGSHIEHFRHTLGRPIFGISASAMDCLLRYAWPGNVRELINVVERAMLLTDDEELGLEDLPEDIRLNASAGRRQLEDVLGGEQRQALTDRPYREARDHMLESFEHQYFARLLERTSGRVGEAAKRSGLSARSLYEKMKRLGLTKESFHASSRAGAGPGK